MDTLPPASDRFRRQHASLFAQAVEIGRWFSPEGKVADPAGCRLALSRFAGALRVHAAMENGALYPRLLSSEDADVSALAHQLFLECGGVYDQFEGYLQRWSVEAIRADEVAFARETRRVMKVLGARMAREDEQLYPMVDRMAG